MSIENQDAEARVRIGKGKQAIEGAQQLYLAQTDSIGISVVSALLLAWVLWGEVSSNQTLATWVIGIAVVLLARAGTYMLFLSHEREMTAKEARAWQKVAALSFIGEGLLWGMAPILLWPESAMYQGLLAAIMIGASVAAITSMTPLAWAAVAFISLSLWPLAGRSVSVAIKEGVPDYLVYALAIVLFICVLSFVASRLRESFHSSLLARLGRAKAEKEVYRMAYYDQLTGLPNRRHLMQALEERIDGKNQRGGYSALFFLDLDKFKNINDSLGHSVGDKLLQAVARRITGNIRKTDVAARQGGDEFVLLLEGLGRTEEEAETNALRRGDKLRDAISEPVDIEGHLIKVSASVGVVLINPAEDKIDDLLRRADIAMYRVKETSRNGTQLFNEQMELALINEQRIARDLERGIEDDQLRVFYQPQVNAEGRIVGLEGLVRWQHPERGLLLPGEFISIAEHSELIYDLHDWLVEQVCKDIKILSDQVGEATCPTVAMNLSAREFLRPGLADQLRKAIAVHRINPALLTLEITETVAMENVTEVIEQMQEVRKLGVNFAIDDFGTGYSSLAYLRELPINLLKIDRSFTKGVRLSEDSEVIIETIQAMAGRLGIETVVEGVEREEVFEQLKQIGCDKYQGWLFGKAMPLSELPLEDSEAADSNPINLLRGRGKAVMV